MPIKLTREELNTILGEQIELLQLSAENFDKGHYATTLQMATTIRVLFHDTDSSKSLIKQICEADGKDKNDFEMVTTKEQDFGGEKLIIFGDGLYTMVLSGLGLLFSPKLSDSTLTKVAFPYWWNEKVIKNVSSGFETAEWMTREELIKLHANKEGGAHVDENKNEKISDIGSKEAAGWAGFTVDCYGRRQEINSSVDQKKVTIRQICYEVLVSLHNHFPELFRSHIY